MNNKNKNKGCMSGFLGTVYVLLGVVGYAIISLLLNRIFTSDQGESSCHVMTFYGTGIAIAFFLYEIIFIVWQIKLSVIAQGKGDPARFTKILKIVAAASISLSLIFAIIGANTYTLCKNDKISKVCFVTTNEYTWNNVSRFILSCNENGTLEYTVRMKDGEAIEIFNTVNTCSDEFLEEHKSLSGYAAYLTNEFRNSGFIIEEQIIGEEYMEKFFKEKTDVWENLQIIIGK